jgi:hypothetical protein
VKVLPAPKSQAQIEDEQRRTNEHAANERGLTIATWTLAAVTLFLVLVGGGQLVLFYVQLRYIRESLNDAKTAADAATAAAAAATNQAQELKRSADATERTLTELERPWLFLESAKVTRCEPPDVPNAWYVGLKWKNVGRTPAINIKCMFRIEDENILPNKPDYSNESLLSSRDTAAPDQEFETGEVGPATGQAKDGKPIHYVFFGRIIYEELNGKVHHTGFAFAVSPHIPAISGYKNDTYCYHS